MTSINSLGIILDGNRRWAKAQGVPTLEGHRAGYEKLKELTSWVREVGIKNLIVYALSTENLKRAPEEVSYLFDLFRNAMKNEITAIAKEDARIIFAGDLALFPEDMQTMAREVMAKTADRTKHTFVIAAPYGGRAELTAAFNALLSEGKTGVSEEDISAKLWTAGTPDPDLIIRTSGEQRLSNFLPWQSTYSELFFTKTLWPDFSKEEFTGIIEEYNVRQRNFGT